MFIYLNLYLLFLLLFLIIGKSLSGVPHSKKPFGLLHMCKLPNLRTKASFSGVYSPITLKFGEKVDSSQLCVCQDQRVLSFLLRLQIKLEYLIIGLHG